MVTSVAPEQNTLEKLLEDFELLASKSKILGTKARERISSEAAWNKKNFADFMTITYRVTKDFKNNCPAAVHVDGTAWPQIVRKENNIQMHELLTAFLKILAVMLCLILH